MAEQKKSKVVRALDLGWGYTKYSKLNAAGELEYLSFPSLAPRASGLGLSLGDLGQRDTIIVSVEGTDYEVGPDSRDLDTNDSTRNLNDQYIHTDQYKAVLRGALHYIGEPVIDGLVVGLPVSGMANAEKLKEMCKGTHKLNAKDSVTVKDVRVVPQPVGGLMYCLSQPQMPGLEYLADEINLVIDPGFLTFDFVTTNGKKIIENRSNAHAGGVSKVLRAICESLSTKFGIKYDNLGAIDKALARRKLRINGIQEDLDEHIRSTRPVIEGSVNYMKNIVGDGADIDNIILLGGGSMLYQKAIKSFYPNHSIVVLENSQMANVMGFQIIGESHFGK